MRVLIVGCGYSGLALGKRLVELGHSVWGMRRSAETQGEMEKAGIIPIQADVSHLKTLNSIHPNFDWVVNLVSSSRGGVEEYRSAYLEGTRNLIQWLGNGSKCRFVYTSSTSVYPQTDGSWVDETSFVAGTNPNTEILLETENLLRDSWRDARFPGIILRVSGIYGPGRGHLFKQFMKGEARITGDGGRYLNMIHREDLAGAIITALEKGAPGQIYNVSDDCPVTEREFFVWLSVQSGREMPPSGEGNGPRKRALTSKRISNQKLKALGWRLRYPSFRDGYSEELEKVARGGP